MLLIYFAIHSSWVGCVCVQCNRNFGCCLSTTKSIGISSNGRSFITGNRQPQCGTERISSIYRNNSITFLPGFNAMTRQSLEWLTHTHTHTHTRACNHAKTPRHLEQRLRHFGSINILIYDSHWGKTDNRLNDY